MQKLAKWASILVIVTVIVVVGGYIGFHEAIRALEHEVVEFLGGQAEIGEVTVAWNRVEIHDFALHGAPGWPQHTDQFRAGLVAVKPDLRQLLKGNVVAGSIRVEQPYLSIVREKNGRVRLVPTILEGHPPDTPPVRIRWIGIRGGTVDVIDRTVGTRLRVTGARAEVTNVSWPALDTRSRLDAWATVVGVNTNGKSEIHGHVTPSTLEADIQTELTNVDLVTFQPYLREAGDAEIEHGTMTVTNMNTIVHNKVLNAKGTVTYRDLALEQTGGRKQKFMGVPANLLIRFMQNHNNAITMKFAVEERIDDPNFDANKVIARAIRTSLAENVGFDFEKPVEKVTELGEDGLDQASDVINKGTEKAGQLFDSLTGG